MIKEGDFIKIEYTGYDDKGQVFDSTAGEVAKAMHQKEGPMLIVFKKDRLLAGLEQELDKMNKGEERELKLTPDKAFGSRSNDMVRIMHQKDFYKSEIMPQVGLMVSMDTEFGTMNGLIKSVSGGRVLIDFNHPLCDKSVRYKIKLLDTITEPMAKINALLEDLALAGKAELVNGKATLTLSKKVDKFTEKKLYIENLLKELIPEIKEVVIFEKE